MRLVYHIEGEMTCAREDGSVYILAVEDKVNKLISETPRQREETEPEDGDPDEADAGGE